MKTYQRSKMKSKYLDAKDKGEMDYDFSNDILFFKVKERVSSFH